MGFGFLLGVHDVVELRVLDYGGFFGWQLEKGCSLLADTHFVLYSKRVVTPAGIGPYAGNSPRLPLP